jgi:hypothetical protein
MYDSVYTEAYIAAASTIVDITFCIMGIRGASGAVETKF